MSVTRQPSARAETAAGVESPHKPQVRLEELDGLRGLLALYVVFYHLSEGLQNKYDVITYPDLLRNGWYAVDVFFVLSGFVMAHVYGAAFAKGVTFDLCKRFFVARIARLYPVHLVVLGIMVLVLTPAVLHTDRFLSPDGRYAWTALLAALAMLHGVWIDHRTWNYPSWSISAEWHAYLLFPVLIRFVRGTGRSLAVLAAGVAIPLALYILSRNGDQYPTNGVVILLRVVPLFAVGIAAYNLRSAAWLGSSAVAAFAVLASLALLLSHLTAPLAVVLVPLLVLATHRNARLGNVFRARPLLFLGKISYSLYMVHAAVQIIILNRVIDGLGPALTQHPAVIALGIAGGIGLSILFGWLLQRFVEAPLRPIVYDWFFRKAGKREKPVQV